MISSGITHQTLFEENYIFKKASFFGMSSIKLPEIRIS
jgi:hypothetical protein